MTTIAGMKRSLESVSAGTDSPTNQRRKVEHDESSGLFDEKRDRLHNKAAVDSNSSVPSRESTNQNHAAISSASSTTAHSLGPKHPVRQSSRNNTSQKERQAPESRNDPTQPESLINAPRNKTSADDVFDEMAKLETETKKYEAQGAKKRAELADKQRQCLQKLALEVKRLVRENTQLRSEHTSKMARLEADKAELQTELTGIRLENEDLMDELEEMKRRLKELGVGEDSFGDDLIYPEDLSGSSLEMPIEIEIDDDESANKGDREDERCPEGSMEDEHRGRSAKPLRTSSRVQEGKESRGNNVRKGSTYYDRWPASNANVIDRQAFSKMQKDKMQLIEEHFSPDRARRHNWYWDNEQNDWSPRWLIKLGIDREEMFKEYYMGLRGTIPVKDLDDHWKHLFWGQHQQSTEFRRRKRMFNLIETLQKERKWSHDKTLQFLRDCYPISNDAREDQLRTASKFIRWLTDENIPSVKVKAAQYA